MRFLLAMSTRVVLLTLMFVLLAAPAAQAKPSARALVSACERGLEEADRAAAFEGQMRKVAGASRMQMRFTLQARTPDTGKWAALSAPGFGAWVTSATSTSRYVYTKRVEGLLAPASYRVLLRFRWLDARGDVIRRAKDYSASCRQPDPRPNLLVRSIGVQPADRPARRRYVVFVRNAGGSVAGASSLLVTVGGKPLPAAPVAELDPGEGLLVTVEGPACQSGAPVVAGADADDAIDERDESDNELTRSC
jgi:CARDB